jgi:cystathionine gamma-lyase
MRFDTAAIHAAQVPDKATGAVNVPVYLSSTFAQDGPNEDRGFVYSRSANPTRSVLERLLAHLEGGAVGLSFSSGLGALETLLQSLPAGSRIVAMDDLYGGSWRLFEHHRRNFGLTIDYVDARDLTKLAEAVQRTTTTLVYLETPTNPLLKIVDLKGAARIARRGHALLAVDNTFASPALQRPLSLGADVVLHSTTKYLGGHSDIIGGALVIRSPELGERLRWLQNAVGAVPGAFDSYLTIRGIRTLGVRMRAHGASAAAVAATLEASSKVRAVLYPGLRSHPQRALAARQMSGFGGMVTIDLAGGEPAARRFLKGLRIFTLAESLGGVESLVEHPALMTHASLPKAERVARGITDGLVRLSCGIEDPEDLVEDVAQALRGIHR